MFALLHDLKYAFRQLFKNPIISLTAMVTIALGVGVNTAVFSQLNNILIKPLPYPDSDQLMILNQADRLKSTQVSVSYPNLIDWSTQSTTFAGMSGFNYRSYNITESGEPERAMGSAVSANLFQMLKVQPLYGRYFLPEDDRPGAARVVLLSYAFWQRRFGGDPSVVGKTMTIDDTKHTIVGVMTPVIRFPYGSEMWTPLGPESEEMRNVRTTTYLGVIGRLNPGVTIEQGQADMDAVAGQILRRQPEVADYPKVTLTPFYEVVVGPIRKTLILLQICSSFVLLIVCANVSAVLLARATGRRKEFAVRMALGAPMRRLLQQTLIEGLLLALLSGALGLLIAIRGTRILLSFGPVLPRWSEYSIDLTVLAFAFAISMLTGAAASVAPALLALKLNYNDIIKQGGRTATDTIRVKKLLRGIAIMEVTLTTVLLISAGLVVKSFIKIVQTETGMRTENLLTMQITLSQTKYAKPSQQEAFFRAVAERLQAVPGAESVGMISYLPLTNQNQGRSMNIVERPLPESENPQAGYRIISGGYFRTMGIPLKKGREFNEHDTADSEPVILVNDEFVRHFMDGNDPTGLHIRLGGTTPEVVGVVGNVKSLKVTTEWQPEIYLPYTQAPEPSMYVAVRTRVDADSVIPSVRNAISEVDRNQPVAYLQTMEQLFSKSVADSRFLMLLLGCLGVVTLILSVIGIYGIVTYLTVQRSQEIGIRMALGARPAAVLRLILRQGMTMALVGLTIGVLASIALTRLLSSLIYGVSTTDPMTYIAIIILFTATILLGCYIPARRAMRTDPANVLRHE
jgi:putative ABC transport system permease protein